MTPTLSPKSGNLLARHYRVDRWKMSDLSNLIIAELKLEHDAKRLGIRRQLDIDKARVMLARCAKEIEKLELVLNSQQKCSACGNFMFVDMPPLSDRKKQAIDT